MKAAVLHEPGGPLVLEDVPLPEVGPGEALVRVRACGLGLTLVCGLCRWCDRGREDLCDHALGQVGRDIDGGLAEYVRLPVRNLCPIPSTLSYVDGAGGTGMRRLRLTRTRRGCDRTPCGTNVLIVGTASAA